MSKSWFLQCYLYITLSSLNIVQTVPPDYCLSPLNRSDCHQQPTSVFSYYKPGSRCEIQTWRGCPTLNMFENEYLCSLHCLFRMSNEVIEETTEATEATEAVTVPNECDEPLNTHTCSNELVFVFTHVNGTCIEAVWEGCPTSNKFEDKATCDTTCKTDAKVPQFSLEKELDKLDPSPLEMLDDILQDIIDEEATTEAETETETEVVTEAETEADTEAETEAESEAETETDPPEETTTESMTEPTTNDDYQEVVHA